MSRVIMAVINEAGGGGGSEGGAKAAVSYLIITTLSIPRLRQFLYKPSPRHYEGNL